MRIADSPIAPVFEVITRPNNWERKLHAIAQETRQISNLDWMTALTIHKHVVK
ncbi:hypothetical protein [Spirulina major]|uniref:hypothetical protein n=1 Tax=Spirulina major TaxID=270636 RepID=UPI00232ECAE6|nr:hypothetical protein [Spirulina major]